MKKYLILIFSLFIIPNIVWAKNNLSSKSNALSNDGILIFNEQSNFDSIVFKENPNFIRVEFNSNASFIDAIFENRAYYYQVNFNSIASFWGADFKSYTDFTAINFNSLADFVNSKFQEGIRFESVYFKAIADFSSAKFHKDVIFLNTQFSNKADFNSAKFNSGSFPEVILPDSLDFSNVEINNEVDFNWAISDSCKDSICKINLYGSDIYKIRLNYNNFQLYFDTSLSFDQKSNVYTELLLRTKELGYESSYKKLDKEFKEFTYLNENMDNPKCLINWLAKNWWGYGYDKELIIRNTFILLLIFSFVNLFILKFLTGKVYSIEKINDALKKTEFKNYIHKIFYHCYHSLVYTILIFFGLKFTLLSNLKYSGNLTILEIAGLIYFQIIYLFGLVCLGYLANYIITL